MKTLCTTLAAHCADSTACANAGGSLALWLQGMSPKEVADAFFRALVNKDASAWVSTLSRQLRGSCKDGGPFSANGWVEGSAKVRRRSMQPVAAFFCCKGGCWGLVV